MNIQDFRNEYENLTNERKRDFANRLLNQLTKLVNQEYKSEGDSFIFAEEILPILEDAEANDYFGTEGFDG